jgi:hypothetical protein
MQKANGSRSVRDERVTEGGISLSVCARTLTRRLNHLIGLWGLALESKRAGFLSSPLIGWIDLTIDALILQKVVQRS